MTNILSPCAPSGFSVRLADKSGVVREFVLDGVRELATVDGEFCPGKFAEIKADIVEAHKQFTMYGMDADSLLGLASAKARRILRKYMTFGCAKYVLIHAAEDPENLDVFMVLCNHGISSTTLLRKMEV